MLIPHTVTRFEVIDHRPGSETFGRTFVAHDIVGRISAQLQDEERTLKIFIV